MSKILSAIVGLIIGTIGIAYAAPTVQNFSNIQPFTNDTYNNGTTTLEWLSTFTKNITIGSAAGTPGCATFDILGVLGNTHVACGSGSGGSYPFTPSTASTTPTSATSTAIDDSGGLFIQSFQVGTSTIACPDGQTIGCNFPGPNSVQAAINAGWNNVHMKSGNYTITSPIYVPRSGFTLTGEGNSTIIRYDGHVVKVGMMSSNIGAEFTDILFRDFQIKEDSTGGLSTCFDSSHLAIGKIERIVCNDQAFGFMASTGQSYYMTYDTDEVVHLISHNGSNPLLAVGFYLGDPSGGDSGPINNTIINGIVNNFVNGSSTAYYFNSHSIKCISCDSEGGYIGVHLGPRASDFNGLLYLEANAINLTMDASAAQVGGVNITGNISDANPLSGNIVNNGVAALCVNARVQYAGVNYCTDVKQGFGTNNPLSVLEVSNEAENNTPGLANDTPGLFGGRGTAINLDFASGASWSGRSIVNDSVSSNFPILDFVVSTSTEAGIRFVSQNSLDSSSNGTGNMLIQAEASSAGYAIFEGRATSTGGILGPRGTMISSVSSPVILAPGRSGVLFVSPSGGNTSLGTSTFAARLFVWGRDTSANTIPFLVANNASTTLFQVNNAGTASTTGLIVSNLGGSTSGCAALDILGTLTNSGSPCGSGSGMATTSLQATYPITLSTSTGVAIFGANGLSTTTATCSSGASCTPFTIIGTSPVTISAAGSGASGGGWNFISGGIYNSTTTDQVLVGENSTTTTAKLEVNGALAVKGAATSTSLTTLGLTVNVGNNGIVQLNDKTNASGIWGTNIGFLSQSGLAEITTNGQILSFFTGGTRNSMTAGTERARITVGGALGVATSTPKEQISSASSSAPQFGYLSGDNNFSWVGRNQSGTFWFGTSTLSGATSTSPTYSLDSNGGFTIPSLASAATSCVQVDSTGKFSITGSPCLTAATLQAYVATSSLAATWPITLTTSPSSITYGFGGLTTTTPWNIGDLAMVFSGNQLMSVATSTLTPSAPLTGSITQIGSSDTLGIQAASNSQDGYFKLGDFQLIHSATTTFSSPLVYTQSTNAVTCPTCNTTSGAEHHSFTYSTSTAWQGTTTVRLETGYDEVWNSARCYTDIGTVNVDFVNNNSHLNLLPASTTNGIWAFTTNNTMTGGNKVQVNIGTPASAPSLINCTIKDTPP